MTLPDHDELKKMYNEDPEKYKMVAKKLIDEYIDSKPNEIKSLLIKTQNSLESKLG